MTLPWTPRSHSLASYGAARYSFFFVYFYNRLYGIFYTEHRLVVTEIPCVGGITRAEFSLRAVAACFTERGAVAAEWLESVPPHVGKSVAGNIALYQLRASLNIEAGIYIAVAQYAADVYSRTAYKIIVRSSCSYS